MRLRGLVDILAFLNLLDKHNIVYRIDHRRPDSIMISYTHVGVRVELDFFYNHIEYSLFKGDESVLDDQDIIFRLIAEHV